MDANLYLQEKREGMKTKPLKKLVIKPNNQSADFIAPSFAIGCELACAYCLPAGTMISTPTGEKPIEQIQYGDVVISFDNSTGQFVSGYVSGTTSRIVEELIEIEVDGATIRTSLEHPFLTTRGWIKACDLVETDKLICI